MVSKLLGLGVNFFDTAEVYGFGKCEELLGQTLINLKVRREDVVISTKLFIGGSGPNDIGMSRKKIIEGTRKSLKRLQLSYVDIIFSHRPDFEAPIEETVRAFSWLIDQGLATYWGTSEWPVEMISTAIQFAKSHGLHEPVTEQPQYNMLERERFESEYAPLYERHKYGTTVWSPLAQGILTGRFNDGTKADGSRFTDSEFIFKD